MLIMSKNNKLKVKMGKKKSQKKISNDLRQELCPNLEWRSPKCDQILLHISRGIGGVKFKDMIK